MPKLPRKSGLIIPGVPRDEPLDITITIRNGSVVLQMDRAVNNIVMDANRAATVAHSLAEAARDLTAKSGITLVPTTSQ